MLILSKLYETKLQNWKEAKQSFYEQFVFIRGKSQLPTLQYHAGGKSKLFRMIQNIWSGIKKFQ